MSSLVSDVPMLVLLAQPRCPLPSTQNGGRWELCWASLSAPGLVSCCPRVLRCAGPPARQLGAMHRVLPCLPHTHPSSPWGSARPTDTQGPHLCPIPTALSCSHAHGGGHLSSSILHILSQSHQTAVMNVCATAKGALCRVQWCPLTVLQGDRQGAAAIPPAQHRVLQGHRTTRRDQTSPALKVRKGTAESGLTQAEARLLGTVEPI